VSCQSSLHLDSEVGIWSWCWRVDDPTDVGTIGACRWRGVAAPGAAATDWLNHLASSRLLHVEDIAPLVAFVAGPEAGYITGASLTVDGGTNA
jgi:NAD(P)-dependent dehydrogenase (short-subunit alcohol dehydrogenase family)